MGPPSPETLKILDSAFNGINDGIFILNLDGRIIKTNSAASKLFKIPEKQMLGRFFHEITHGEHYIPDACPFEAMKKTSSRESSFLEREGQWQEIIVDPIIDDEGHLIGGFYILHDITDNINARKNLEDKVLESDLKFSKTFLLSPSAACISDISNEVLMEVNDSYTTLLGYTRTELIGKTPFELGILSREHPKEMQKKLNPLGKVFNAEATLKSKDGTYKTVLISSEIFTTENKKFRYTIINDISAHKKTELQLLKLNRLYFFIGKVNEKILEIRNSQTLYEEVCKIAVEYGKYQMAWIGLLDDKYSVKPLAYFGNESGYLGAIKQITAKDNLYGRGPTGRSIREQKTVACNDIEHDPIMEPWREEALKRNYLASISIPILVHGSVIGTFTMYSDKVNFFSSGEEIELLENVTRNISYALESIQSDEERQRAEKLNLLHNEALMILNSDIALYDMLNKIIKLIQKETQVSAIGFRLKKGDDYPYIVYEGFSDRFIQSENNLILKDKSGKACVDDSGKALLGCTCGLVISGKTDPENSLFTPYGSFISNDSRPILDLPPALDPRLQPRNKCILLGFNSMAIIPIQTTKGILGSLHLNDKFKNAFNKDTVNFLERVALSLGNVLMRLDAQNDLIESQTKLNAIFDNTHTGFFLLDTHFNIISCNSSAKELAKKAFTKDVFLDENFLNLIPDDRMAEVSRHLQSALSGVEIHYDVAYPQNNNTEVWFDKHYKPVFNEKNEVSGISLSITDFSKRKTAEKEKEILIKELSNKNNELMQFNYIVSHNLRSPVANLMGLSNLFKLNVLDDADKLKVIDQIGKASANMDAIIKDLNIILSTRSAINTHKEHVHMIGLLEGISHTLEAQIEESECHIESIIHPDAISIFTVKSYIESVLYNLINNAIKYRCPKRKLHIRISTHKKQDRFVLEVSDNGKGIDMHKHGNYIFGLYKRFHPELEGKGLGLHISKTQVEALGGSIHVDSEVDKGSTFVVSLPIHTSNEA